MSINDDGGALPPANPVINAIPAQSHARDAKLPDFWAANPRIWFKQVEAVFRRCNITNSFIMYDYVLMKLPTDVLDTVVDIINEVEDDTPDAYERLRDRLIGDYGMSQWQRAARIVDFPGLGDGRPSAMMSAMLALLPPGEKAGVLFQYHFMRHLPSEIRSHLAAKTFDSARDMASHADLLWDANGAGRQVNALGGSASGSRSSSPGRGRRQSPGRTGKHRSQTPGPSTLCFYHSRFAERATKCRAPCTWQGNGLAAGGN